MNDQSIATRVIAYLSETKGLSADAQVNVDTSIVRRTGENESTVFEILLNVLIYLPSLVIYPCGCSSVLTSGSMCGFGALRV
jgi:hypothetical protein